MNETPKYVKEVQHILANIHENGNSNQDTEPHALPLPENEIDMYVEEDRITFIPRRLHGIPVNQQDIVDSVAEELDMTPLPTQPASNVATGILPFGVFVILSCITSIMFQFYMLFNPLTVSVTIAARSQQVSLTGTLQLGRVLNPITLSQSQTVPTTGHGHQDAKQATGYITFYNGQLTSVFIPAGTTLTGNSGVQIITDQDANIPAANLPQVSQATVSAHAVHTGSSGNIASYDINQGCCNGVKAVNTMSFSGGQDERNFQTVAKSDIDLTASQLKDTLNQGTQGALQGELKAGEVLTIPACNPTVTPDHQIGQEATTVKVTVSETCSGIAYNDQELTSKVTQLLTTQATEKLGSGYSMLENPQITVASAITSKPLTLSFRSVSTWVYALTTQEQQHSKKIIAGKYKQNALQLLYSLPGIESVSLQFSGFGDDTKLPKDISHIHLLIIYTAA